jgi:hypothetical protein
MSTRMKNKYIFYYGKGRKYHSFRTGFVEKKHLESADKKEVC